MSNVYFMERCYALQFRDMERCYALECRDVKRFEFDFQSNEW